MQKNELAVITGPLNTKQIVRNSLISTGKAILSIVQNGCTLYTDVCEGKNLSHSFAELSGNFHYNWAAKRVTLDKYNPLTVRLTFANGENEMSFPVTLQPKTDSKGANVPYTSSKVASTLKTIYAGFAADILIDVTRKGTFMKYVQAANGIANFTPSFSAMAKKS